VQSFGHTSNDQAISYWLRGSQSKASLLSEDFTECGTAAYYSQGSAHTYTRCVLLSAPGVVNEIDWPDKDPAKEKAEASDDALEKIEAPKPDSGQPLNVVEVVAHLVPHSLLGSTGHLADSLDQSGETRRVPREALGTQQEDGEHANQQQLFKGQTEHVHQITLRQLHALIK
jgi:hypothetical protein